MIGYSPPVQMRLDIWSERNRDVQRVAPWLKMREKVELQRVHQQTVHPQTAPRDEVHQAGHQAQETQPGKCRGGF